jgi:hypothetical protein
MMNAIVKKLAYKLQTLVLIQGAPDSFSAVMDAFAQTAELHTNPRKGTHYSFVVHFVRTTDELKKVAKTLALTLDPDAVLWMAYPKKTSKKYQSDINRDEGWQPLGDLGFEPVSQVAIDEDWSALRFRKVDFIKTMSRRAEMTLSKAGKKKAAGKK